MGERHRKPFPNGVGVRKLVPPIVVSGQDKIIAGIAKRGLWQTTDGGATWTPLGQGTGSEVIVNRPSRILYDPANPDLFWESGIYNSSGIYRTTNGGRTFQHLGSV